MCTSTGWTLEYLLWGLSWINLQMMISDASYYSADKEKEKKELPDDIDEIAKILNL